MTPDAYAWRPAGNGGGRGDFWRRWLWQLKGAYVTDIIIGLCLVALVVGMIFPAFTAALLFFPWFAEQAPWTLLTSAFLHAGFWHFAFNMIALYMVGRPLEQRLGRMRYALLYLFSAVCGNLAVWAWAMLTNDWAIAVVGASGAVFGLLGAWLALAGVGSSNFRSIMVILVINLLYGLMQPAVSWQSHVGGFIGGFAVTWLGVRLARRLRRGRRR